jgi:imidazolonepropionase-like amidohydrolase
LLAAALTVSLLAVGAERPRRPRQFAIHDARIVPVSGPVVERGTIVVENGLIAAVGPAVEIPPGAWVIQGEGLTVYPGLIDSLTTLGLPTDEKKDSRAGRPASQNAPTRPIRGPEDRPATTPWNKAADHLSLKDKRLKQWRQAGFTTAVTSPEKGLVAGQAAMINLAGERPRQMVVKTPVGLRLNLTPPGSFRTFPGSLMGVIAYIKQLFLDAEHYGAATTLYENQAGGQERPEYDRTLEPIHRAVRERWPVLLPATWAKEIERALDLGEKINANTVLYGAQQGYAAAETLAAAKAPVLVSLEWPEKDKESDPERGVSLRELRFRDQAPSTPAALQGAGVRFAFYSGGIKKPADILNNVRRAIEAGLPAEAALRALTLSAAEIYGVSDRLGSLEPGKIANLTVTEGDLFAEDTKVKMVFIDGQKYEERVAPDPASDEEESGGKP